MNDKKERNNRTENRKKITASFTALLILFAVLTADVRAASAQDAAQTAKVQTQNTDTKNSEAADQQKDTQNNSAAEQKKVTQNNGAAEQKKVTQNNSAAEQKTEQKENAAGVSDPLGLTAKAAVLMNAETGQIVYALNAQQQLPEASITKIMTMLLVFEAYDAGRLTMEETVTCSEYAASMGGSQIWLEPNEQMTVHELIKAALVGSANDACVALGEHIAGSNEAFVSMMNDRAEELGMTNTFYVNCTGLDADGHVTSAEDIAIASAELLKHEAVLNYTKIWMDTLRGGALQLTNTNKLIKQYSGAIGLKTGTTSKAGCCISAAAQRDGMTMIAVILGAPDSKSRFGDAKKLLDYGFANWELKDVSDIAVELPEIPVTGGIEKTVGAYADISGRILTEKGKAKEIKAVVDLPETLEAPIELQQPIGTVRLMIGSETVGIYDVCADRASEKVTFGAALRELLRSMVKN